MVRQVALVGLVLGSLLLLPTATLRAADEKPDELLSMIVRLLGEKDSEFRAAGLDQIRSGAKGAAATKVFAAQLPKLDSSAQAALLSALADRGDVAARPAVLELLKSNQDEDVRAAAVAALGSLGEAADVPLLIQSLAATSNAERTAARSSLSRIRGAATSARLAAESGAAVPAVKAALFEVLATRRAKEGLPVLLAAIVDDSPQVRGQAMAALGQIGDPRQIAEMLPGVLKADRGSERDAAERNVALVCARIENDDSRGQAVIKALESVSPAQADQLLSLVGRVGGARLVDYVAEIATSKDAQRRKLAIDALSKWPNAGVADKLLEIINKAADSGERSQAFQGYVKISAARDNRSERQRLARLKQAMTLATTPEEESLVINRCRTAYDVETLRFVRPYLDRPEIAQVACETLVELAHHRELRDPHKAEFDAALDKIIEVSKDPVVVDRAGRYKRGETWARPVR